MTKATVNKGGLQTPIVWTNELDTMIRLYADRAWTVKRITEALNETLTQEGQRTVSPSSVRNRMTRLGYLSERQMNYKRIVITDRMKDFVYVYRYLPIKDLSDKFNRFFKVKLSQDRIMRIVTEAEADPDRILSESKFRRDWYALQVKFAPHGEIRSQHWLWRYTRLDGDRTAAGITYGKDKSPVRTYTERELASANQ